ncbi:MAG: glycosyltransferase family 2 protein [Parvibaculales bacterium]
MPNTGMANKDKNNSSSQPDNPGFQDFSTTPLIPREITEKARLYKATNLLKNQHPDVSASHPKQALAVELLVFAFFLLFITYLLLPSVAAMTVASLCLLLVLNEMVCLARPPQRQKRDRELKQADLPTYTVLLPLFKEAHMIPQLVKAMAALHYPPERLEILFIVEEEDETTFKAVKTGLALGELHAKTDIIIVPPSRPQTKPKACNYALTFAKGSLIVVYDAEDRPHPDQLREAAELFAASQGDKTCLQAPLVIRDRNYDLLGALMALNYTTQFNLQMSANARLGLPVFFGGTSNHMRRRDLADIGGWDPHNVTEDAELSLRMVKQGYKIGMLDRPTYETATRGVWNHLTQRCRWQKGSFQTLSAHFGSLNRSELKPLQACHVTLMLINRIMSPLFYLLLLLSMALMEFPPLTLHSFTGQVIVLCLVMLIFLNLCACLHQRRFGLLLAVPLLPLHWLFLSLTFLFAIEQLLSNPSYWHKTPHNEWTE